MVFSQEQIDKLILRLRQTKEELLFDYSANKVQRYEYQSVGANILGVAHCDYVERAWSYPTLLDDTTVQAGQVDDRVGVWILLDILPNIKGMPKFDYLLTTDEEIGQSSAKEAGEQCNLDYNWTFQFDRRGTDFVDYDFSSADFISKFANTTGIKHARGSFSDICYLPASCGSRVNIGCGYYNEHRVDAWVDLTECAAQVEKFVLFAKKYHNTAFPVREQIDPFAYDDICTVSEQSNYAALPADSDPASIRAWLIDNVSKNTTSNVSGTSTVTGPWLIND